MNFNNWEIKTFFIVIYCCLLTACSNPIKEHSLTWPSIKSQAKKTDSSYRDNQPEDKQTKLQTPKKQPVNIQIGDQQKLIGKVPSSKYAYSDKKGTRLNFKDVDLRAFVNTVLGEVLKTNFIIDPKVNGRVTIQTVNPIPKSRLLSILQEVLELNGATLIRKSDGYRVVPLIDADKFPLTPRIKRLKNQGFGMQIVPLRYISAPEMQKVLKQSLKTDDVVYADPRRNLLILTGTEQEIESAVDLISVFDVHWLKGKSVTLFPLEYVSAKEMLNELSAALGGEDGHFFDGLVRLIPIERINSLLVVSNNKDYLADLANWIKRLDVTNNSIGRRLYVYHLKNAKAVDIADTLSNIFQSKSGSSNKTSAELINPSDVPVRIQRSQTSAPEDGAVGSHKLSNSKGIDLIKDATVKIIADKKNNALVVMATPEEYEMVQSAIKQLDVLPKQVLIEVMILEVALTGDLSNGVEWFFKNGVGSGRTGQGQLSLGNDGIAAITPGFSYSIVDKLGNVKAVLNMLESESQVHILSSPSIMVLDNSSAEINVGDQIPVPSRQAVSNVDSTAPTVNEIEYKNTGVLLSVSPQINTGGLVTLDVNQEVSDAQTTATSGIDAPTISQRSIKTKVAIQDGQSVLLGGLIKRKKQNSRSGVPGLSRLPLIGGLFGQSSDSDQKSELLMILTPHVVENASAARRITEEYRDKLLPEFSSMKTSSLNSVDE